MDGEGCLGLWWDVAGWVDGLEDEVGKLLVDGWRVGVEGGKG